MNVSNKRMFALLSISHALFDEEKVIVMFFFFRYQQNLSDFFTQTHAVSSSRTRSQYLKIVIFFFFNSICRETEPKYWNYDNTKKFVQCLFPSSFHFFNYKKKKKKKKGKYLICYFCSGIANKSTMKNVNVI